jgi:hypothetical protein
VVIRWLSELLGGLHGLTKHGGTKLANTLDCMEALYGSLDAS